MESFNFKKLDHHLATQLQEKLTILVNVFIREFTEYCFDNDTPSSDSTKAYVIGYLELKEEKQ